MAIEELVQKENYFHYLEVSIIIILLQTIFDQYLNYRQLKKLNDYNQLPENLKLFNVDYEQYKKSKLYSKDKMQFSIKVDIFKLILDLLLLRFFYYPYIWKLSSLTINYFQMSDTEYKRIPIMIIIETIRETLISIPFSYYKDFYIEEKHGFNKKTIKLFIKDLILGIALTLILSIPIILGLIWVIEAGGKYFYIYVEIFIILVMFLMITIYPHLIAPLFNKFTELEEGPLKEKIGKLASEVNFPLTKIFVIDGSKRSSHSNAYFFGLGKNKRIVLFDTLLTHMNHEEILAVLCHELGHWKFGHMWKNMINSFLQIFVIFYLYGFFSTNDELFLSYGFHDKSIFIGLALFMRLYSPISFVLSTISLKISRMFEFQADEYAVKKNYGELLCSGLIKLFKENSGDMDPDPIYASFHYTHPTFVERMTFIKKIDVKSN